MNRSVLAGAAALTLFASASASAHITLEVQEAAPNTTYRAVLRVGHGCEGSPTTAVRVQIPEGMIAAKPMPKPGWELGTKTEKYQQAYDYFGEELVEGVTEIGWTGGNLPDDWYDEFVFRGRLTDFEPGTVLYFPVVQECADGVHRWIELPAAGQDPDELAEPAPSVLIVAPSE